MNQNTYPKLEELPLNEWVKYHTGLLGFDRSLEGNRALHSAAESYYRATGCFDDKAKDIFLSENVAPKAQRTILRAAFTGDLVTFKSRDGKSEKYREMDYFVMRIA